MPRQTVPTAVCLQLGSKVRGRQRGDSLWPTDASTEYVDYLSTNHTEMDMLGREGSWSLVQAKELP